jgi:signal peptidase I
MLYILIIYGMGFVFGFVRSKYSLSPEWCFKNVSAPLIITLVCVEFIRSILYNQKVIIRVKKWNLDLSKILTFIAVVLIDIVITLEVYSFTDLESSLIFFGLVLFPSISNNIVLNYLSVRYDKLGSILYRIVYLLYPLFISIIPDVHMLVLSILNLVYPYLVFIAIEFFFETKKEYVPKKKEKGGFIFNAITIAAVVGIMMVVSCQFKYKALVIATYSMTGTIDKGDVIVYEEYTNQYIEEDDIIVFNYNGLTTIHRVIDVEYVNGQTRYYTKGDANAKADDGYRVDSDIEGVLNFNVKYIGYPTLWLRDIFK